MKYFTLFALLLGMIGCASSEPDFQEAYPGVLESDLAPTLETIADTGEYDHILINLTVGLEQAGYMNEAAAVQEFQVMENPAEVKRLAGRLAKKIRQNEQKRTLNK